MLETQTFNSNLENAIKRIVYEISNDDFQKYLYAKGNRILPSKLYEEKLNELYEEKGDAILNSLHTELIKEYESKGSVFTKALSEIIEKSLYVSKSFSFNSIASDDVLKNIISNKIDELDLDDFVSNFVCSDLTSAKSYVESLLKSSDFINKIIEIIRYGGTTELLANEFIKVFKSNLMSSPLISPTMKNELEDWCKNFSGKKRYYDLFNDFIDKMSNVLNRKKSIKLDATTFNDQREKFYDTIFNGGSINNFSYYSPFPSLIDNLVKEIIDITYSSASKKSKYVNYDNQRVIVYDNNHIIPSKVFENVLDELSRNDGVLVRAMSNYYMFLSGDEVVFYDEDGKKYSFQIDENIHILGLENKVNKIYDYFNKNLVNGYDFLFPIMSSDYSFSGGIDSDIDSQLTELVGILQDYSIDLKERISSLNNAQGIVKKLMTTDDYSQKIDLLVYFYFKEYNGVNAIKDGIFDKILKTNSLNLLKILEKYSVYFGNDFINEFKNDGKNDILQEFVSKYNYSSYCEQVIKKFDCIFDLQNFLTNQYSMLATEVLMLRKPTGSHSQLWKPYFSDGTKDRKLSYSNTSTSLNTISSEYNSSFGIIKLDKVEDKYILKCLNNGIEEIICSFYLNDEKKIISSDITNPNFDVEFNAKNRLKIHRKDKYDECLSIVTSEQSINMEYIYKSLGVFPLASIYIQANKKKFSSSFSGNYPINMLKIYDKLLYFNHFNFLIDKTNLYITDLQVAQKPGIVCEIKALNSDLFIVYDYVDSSGKTHFVSAQDVNELVTVKSNVSLLPDIINFKSKEYKTILGFCEKKKDVYSNILTQGHSDFKKKKFTLGRILNLLKDDDLILRYGTSGSLFSDYRDIEALNEVLSNAENINFIDLLKRNLIGCSNALLWLETVDYESFKNFVGSPNISFLEEGPDFDNIKVYLYKNILKNISLLISKIDDELKYKDMLKQLNQYRITGDSVLLDSLKTYLRNNNPEDFNENDLKKLSTVNAKADYLEVKLKMLPNGFLLDSQIEECEDIRKKLEDYKNRYDIGIIGNVIEADERNSDTFKFIEEMAENKPALYNQFLEDIRLRYPICFVSCLYDKLLLCSCSPGPYTEKVRRVLLDRKEENNSMKINTYVNNLMNKKDEDYSLMVFLEAKIVSYIEYIEEVKKSNDVNFDKLILLYSELIRIFEQKASLLSKKYRDYEDINNKTGLVANVMKFVDNPKSRQSKVEKEFQKLDKKRKEFNNVYELYKLMNVFINSSSTNIKLSTINDLFSLGRFYDKFPSSIIEAAKNKISELRMNSNLEQPVLTALNALELRIQGESELNKYYVGIEKKLSVNKENLIRYQGEFYGNSSMFSNSQLDFYNANLNLLQKELDGMVLNNFSSMYQFVNVTFGQYPEYKELYLRDINQRIKDLYDNYSDFKYKDFVELVVEKWSNELSLSISTIHFGIGKKLNEGLYKVENPDQIFALLSNNVLDEFDKISDTYNYCYRRIHSSLNEVHFLNVDGNMINEKLAEVISSDKIIDDYIECVIKSLDIKLGRISTNYGGYVAGSEYNYTLPSAGWSTDKKGINSEIADLVYSNLIALYKFLLLSKKDGTPLIDDSTKICEYWSRIKNSVIEILTKRSLASRRIINLINSEELESASVGKK